MYNHTFYRAGEALYAFIYTSDGEIVTMTYQNKDWSKPKLIVRDVRGNFSVNTSPDGKVYILAQDNQGNIRLSTNPGNDWHSQVIMKSLIDNGQDVSFSAIVKDNNFTFIYDIPPSEEDKSSYLVTQQLDSVGVWNQPVRLDRFTRLNGAPYQLQTVTAAHALLFYQTGETHVSLGYRELTPERIGAFTPFHHTQGYIFDSSYLTTQDSVHVCYVIRSLFSSQFIYRKRDFSGFSTPITLWEGNKIENCLLGFFGGKLAAYFTTNGFLYRCVSEDDGKSFSRPAKHRQKVAPNLIKAKYISSLPMSESKFFVREVYVDEKNPQDIQLMSDIWPDFFPAVLDIPISITDDRQHPKNHLNFFEPVSVSDTLLNRPVKAQPLMTAASQPQLRIERQTNQPNITLKSFEEDYNSFFNQEFNIPKQQSNQETDLREYVDRLSQKVSLLTRQVAERDRTIAETETKLKKQEELVEKMKSIADADTGNYSATDSITDSAGENEI